MRAFALFFKRKELLRMCSKKSLCLLWILLLWVVSGTAKAEILTLRQAENLALTNAQELIALQNEQQARERTAAIDNHLKSPSLQIGGEYPKDVLPSLPSDETTAVMLGVKQPLPQLHEQTLQSLTSGYLTKAHAAQLNQMKAVILREVRENWLSLYECLQIQRILEQQRAINPIDNLQRLQIQNQITQAREQESILREHLKRQIGKIAITASLPEMLPTWPDLPSQKALEMQLLENPRLQADSHFVRASQQSVKLAETPRNSGLNLSVGYGYGFEQKNAPPQNNFDTNDKSKLITFRLTIPLSSSSSPSQDKEVEQHVRNLETHQQQQRKDFLKVKKLLVEAYEDWQKYSKQVADCKNQEGPVPKTLHCLHATVNQAKSQAQVYYLLGK
jgi:hypothetical protein